jgi:hypothetical protein
MGNEEKDFEVHFICPHCNKSGYFIVPFSQIRGTDKGLTTIYVPENNICEHSFQAFVDKNGWVRGYETADFELKLENIEKTESLEYLGDKSTLDLIRNLFGQELFYKLLRSAVNGIHIYCITENEYLQKHFTTFLKTLFGQYSPQEIVAISQSKYEEMYTKANPPSKNKKILVLNSDLNIIIKEPFKKGYRADEYIFEISLLNFCERDNKDSVIDTLKKMIQQILELCIEIKQDIDKNKIDSAKAVDKKIASKINTAIRLNANRLNEILQSRLDFDMNKKFSMGLLF